MSKPMTPDEFDTLLNDLDQGSYQHKNVKEEYDKAVNAYTTLYTQHQAVVEACKELLNDGLSTDFDSNEDYIDKELVSKLWAALAQGETAEHTHDYVLASDPYGFHIQKCRICGKVKP